MQKAQQAARPPRARQTGAPDAHGQQTPQARQGSPDWAMEQQELRGNQTVLGMIGSDREAVAVAGGRPVGRMVEWTPGKEGTTKVNAVFPPGTRVTMDDVGTIQDRWGMRVERWEEINGNVHIEFTTKAPEDLFAWGADVILGKPPPETELMEVQEDERQGRGLLAAASAGLAAALLAPAGAGLAAPKAAAALPETGAGSAGPATASAAAGGGLTATLLAAALGTAGPTTAPGNAAQGAATGRAAPGAAGIGTAPAVAQPGLAPQPGVDPLLRATPGLSLPGLAPTPAPAPGRATQAPTPDVAAKVGVLEARVKDSPAKPAPAVDPDKQLAPVVQAFRRALSAGSPDLGAVQRIATATSGPRLFELVARGATEEEIRALVTAARRDPARQGLLDLLGDQLYPLLGTAAQAAWDAALEEEAGPTSGTRVPATPAASGKPTGKPPARA